jgi:hypothetical protein
LGANSDVTIQNMVSEQGSDTSGILSGARGSLPTYSTVAGRVETLVMLVPHYFLRRILSHHYLQFYLYNKNHNQNLRL